MEVSHMWANEWEADELLTCLITNNVSLQTQTTNNPSQLPPDFDIIDDSCSLEEQPVSSSSLSWTSSSSPSSSDNANNEQSNVNRLISAVYSGPTLFDIENALSVTSGSSVLKELSHSRMTSLDKGLNKSENRYTLKIKSSCSGLTDDGYKWRKYGQKCIKNSPNPRSYYKCTNPRCGAKKQVERSLEDPDTLIITYEGLHLHFAYPYLFRNQAKPLSKKSKTTSPEINNNEAQQQSPTTETQQQKSSSSSVQGTAFRGLLEDIVPLTVRNPMNEDEFIGSSPSPSPSSCYIADPSSPTSPAWPHLPLLWNPEKCSQSQLVFSHFGAS